MCQYACFRKMIGCRVAGILKYEVSSTLQSVSHYLLCPKRDVAERLNCSCSILAAPAFFCLWNIPQQGWNGAGHWRHESPRTTGGMHHRQTYLWLLKGVHYVLSFYACVLNRLDGHVSRCIMSKARKCMKECLYFHPWKEVVKGKSITETALAHIWFM